MEIKNAWHTRNSNNYNKSKELKILNDIEIENNDT